MHEQIAAGIRAIYATQGETLTDDQVANLTNILMEQCLERDLPRTQIWRIKRHHHGYGENTVEWLHFSVYPPRVEDVFDVGVTFDPAENTIEIEGPYDFFHPSLHWPWRRVVFTEHPEPSNVLPLQIDASNYMNYVNTCGTCGLVIGDKEAYYCEQCQIGTCTQCHTDLVESDLPDDPEAEDVLLCEACGREFSIP